jgi:pimeloyl-ACP methyl ester carboxylesterase
MIFRKTVHAARAASFGFIVVAASISGAAAQSNPHQGVTNIVLVHGAWADGSSWSKVIPLLEAKGLHVVAVQNPLTSLADDVAATKRVIALQDGPVLLVGHSYAGVVITQAGNDPKVAGLVYVAAYAPDQGESALSLATAYPTPVGAEIRPDASGFLMLTPKGISEDFAQDLSSAEKQVLTVTQGQTAGAAFGAPVTTVAWKTKPTWFIIAANDRVISPELERSRAEKMKATVITISANHVVMLSQPAKVADFIVEAAAKAALDQVDSRQ